MCSVPSEVVAHLPEIARENMSLKCSGVILIYYSQAFARVLFRHSALKLKAFVYSQVWKQEVKHNSLVFSVVKLTPMGRNESQILRTSGWIAVWKIECVHALL